MYLATTAVVRIPALRTPKIRKGVPAPLFPVLELAAFVTILFHEGVELMKTSHQR